MVRACTLRSDRKIHDILRIGMPFLKLDARARARVWKGKTKKATSVSRACLNAAAMALNLQMPADVCPAFCLAFMRGSFPPHTLRSMIRRLVAGGIGVPYFLVATTRYVRRNAW